jgi:hypothetical protein
MLECIQQEKINVTKNEDGDILLPLFADVTGTWYLVFQDDSEYSFEAVIGELMVIPNHFTNNAENVFQLRRPESGTVFNDICYNCFYSEEDVDEEIQHIQFNGSRAINIDAETEEGYESGIVGAKNMDVFKNGALQQSGTTYDDETGDFTWTFEAGDKITLKWFK